MSLIQTDDFICLITYTTIYSTSHLFLPKKRQREGGRGWGREREREGIRGKKSSSGNVYPNFSLGIILMVTEWGQISVSSSSSTWSQVLTHKGGSLVKWITDSLVTCFPNVSWTSYVRGGNVWKATQNQLQTWLYSVLKM